MRKTTTHRCTFLNADRLTVSRRMENVQLCGNERRNIDCGDHLFTLWRKRL
jgi:hypothetical protein